MALELGGSEKSSSTRPSFFFLQKQGQPHVQLAMLRHNTLKLPVELSLKGRAHSRRCTIALVHSNWSDSRPRCVKKVHKFGRRISLLKHCHGTLKWLVSFKKSTTPFFTKSTTYGVIGEASRQFSPLLVPRKVKDAACPPVLLDDLPLLHGPHIKPPVEGATGDELSIGTKRNRVDGVSMLVQHVKTAALLHLPQTDGGIKGCAERK